MSTNGLTTTYCFLCSRSTLSIGNCSTSSCSSIYSNTYTCTICSCSSRGS
nr:MAG TPA: hypothetical protein [Myoviridae sp. ctfA14]